MVARKQNANGRVKAAPRRVTHEQLVQKVRDHERKAVEKAIDIAIKIYGPAFKELEKY